MTGEQQRAAAAARWAALSPAERRAATEAARAAAAEARAKAAAKRAKRAAEQQAAEVQAVLTTMRADILAVARRIAGPDCTDVELADQAVLISNAMRGGTPLADLYPTTDRSTTDEYRRHEEGRPACQPDARAVHEDHRHEDGTAQR